jgi:tetratricopeptide (TPR) repeat protein
MKRKRTNYQVILFICISFLTGYANAQDANPCKTGGQTCYFGIELNNILCGYSVETYCDGILNGKKVRYEYSDVTLKMSLLGTDMDTGFKILYAVDPVSERVVRIEIQVINEQSVVKSETTIKGDTLYFNNPTSGIENIILVGKDVVFDTPAGYPYLLTDFIKKGVNEKKYRIFDPIKGEVVEKDYVRKSEKDITLADSVFHTLILEETDLSTGNKTTLWLNKSDGHIVKVLIAGRNIYYADKSVTSKITMANMDKVLFAKVGKIIPDIPDLSWLKVKVLINSYGEILTTESLNFPGQKFEGTVTGNLVDGVFEIEPVRYSGKNAPPFPPDFRRSPELKKYLEPEMVIESDDPLIISEATRITAGSKDSWEAAVRLSKWVSENIAGALPGGISAINTLKTQEAECGGHSRLLAAFCRAVGIPAKLSVGCMYTNYHSGVFGQHAWTEVYMGDAGWIPIDATISEINYVDASHIRLGEKATFQPVAMKILDYKTGNINKDVIIPDGYTSITGSYMNLEQYRMFKILFKDNSFAISIPGRMELALNPPDDQGKWYPKLTREISLSAGNSTDGKVDKLIMHQYYRLKKVSAPDTGLNEISEEFRKFVGNYQFAPAKLSLDVMFRDGVLTTQEPLGRSKERIRYSKTGEKWIDNTGSYEIGFITNSENNITSMNLTMIIEFLRGEPVTNVIDPVIKDSGLEAGLKKYDEIKNSGNSEYLFSEQMLHQLGHSLLKENRIDDAIKIFLKNVHEYPKSFIANDALAETYLKKGENRPALKYFKIAVKLNPEYEYGRKMIEELRTK